MIRIQYTEELDNNAQKCCKNCNNYADCKMSLQDFEDFFDVETCKKFEVGEIIQIYEIKNKKIEDELMSIIKVYYAQQRQ